MELIQTPGRKTTGKIQNHVENSVDQLKEHWHDPKTKELKYRLELDERMKNIKD